MTATVALISDALTTIWPQDKIEESMFKECPTVGILPKSDGFVEDDMIVVFKTGPTGGGSQSFANAQANISPSSFSRVRISRVQDYQVFRITTEALRAARNKGPQSLLNIAKSESASAMYAFGRSAAVGAFGSGSGSMGSIASGSSSDTITLNNIADIVNFEQGMVLESDTVDGGGTVDNFQKTIGSVDYDLGTLTTDDATDWDSAGGFAANAFLFRHGDYDNKMLGLAAWIPLTVSSGDSFGDDGLDRSVNRTRLAGIPYTANLGTDGTLQRTFTNWVEKIYRIGRRHKPDCIVVNSVRYANLINELGSAVVYDKMSAKGMDNKDTNFGFQTIKLATSQGIVDILGDANCPLDLAYALTKSTWKIKHLGGFPSWLDDDGNHGLRRGDADALEWRLGAYFNMYCDDPVKNGVCDLSALPSGL